MERERSKRRERGRERREVERSRSSNSLYLQSVIIVGKKKLSKNYVYFALFFCEM